MPVRLNKKKGWFKSLGWYGDEKKEGRQLIELKL